MNNLHDSNQQLEVNLDSEKLTLLGKTLEELIRDSERLDWLNNNFFNDEKDKLQTMMYKDHTKWVFYSPKQVQGDVRRVIDEAMNNE